MADLGAPTQVSRISQEDMMSETAGMIHEDALPGRESARVSKPDWHLPSLRA